MRALQPSNDKNSNKVPLLECYVREVHSNFVLGDVHLNSSEETNFGQHGVCETFTYASTIHNHA